MVKVEGESNGMASLSQLECGPVSNLSPESSFIVVGHGSMTSSEDLNSEIRVDPSISNPPNQTRPGEPGEIKQPSVSLMSSSYVNPKDIQQKLDLVLQENLELKETLHQNNLAMRKQMETLAVWQNEVAKVQQSHSEKFQQTKDLVINLRAENTELRRQLEKVQQSGEEMAKQSSLDASKSGPDSAELEEERNRRLAEESKSKTLMQENAELAKLKKKVDQQYENLVAENTSLRKHLEKYRFYDGKMEELNKVVQQLTHKLETSERGRRQLEFDLEKAMFGHTDNNLLQLSNENCVLKTTLAEANKQLEALKKKLDEFTKKSEQSDNGHEAHEEKVPEETMSQQHFKERFLEAESEIQFLRHQLDETQDTITAREETCSQKAKQIEDLQRKIFSMETRLEAIPILEAQVEVYQADFHAEREARQQAVSEKEHLERILRGANIQLHPADEAQNNLGDSRPNDARRSENNSLQSLSHLCPICSKGFCRVADLERHVDECLQRNP